MEQNDIEVEEEIEKYSIEKYLSKILISLIKDDTIMNIAFLT